MPAKTDTSWGDFAPLDHETRYRLVWRSWGQEKTGKDHFGLTAPGPIAIQSFDVGLEGVVEKFMRPPLGPKEIRAIEYEFKRSGYGSPEEIQQAAIEVRDKFIADYQIALKKARTIIWDTETEVWETFRAAEFLENEQGVSTDAPRYYVRVNGIYRDLVQQAYDTGVNLQLIQKVKERWKENAKGSPVPSGVFNPSGFKEAGYLVQANFEHTWDKERGFILKCINCRQNMELAQMEFENTNFTDIAMAVFPESSEEDWR